MSRKQIRPGIERRSALKVVTKMADVAILKMQICQTGNWPVRCRLQAFRAIAEEMGWTELVAKCDKTLALDDSHPPGQDVQKGGTHVAEER